MNYYCYYYDDNLTFYFWFVLCLCSSNLDQSYIDLDQLLLLLKVINLVFVIRYGAFQRFYS